MKKSLACACIRSFWPEGFNPSHAKVLSGRRGFRSINNLERHLLANRTSIVKIFLNLSPEEQRKRTFGTAGYSDKNWKFSEGGYS